MKPDCHILVLAMMLAISALPLFSAAVTLPVKVISRLPTLNVQVNGKGPFHFLIDTGSEVSLIDARVASRLGLLPTHRLELVTMAGSRPKPVSKVQLGIGSLVLESDVVWMDGDLVDRRARIDGVIGQNVLAGFNYLLEYDRRLLTLSEVHDEVPGVSGHEIPCRKGGSRCEVTVPVGVHGRVPAPMASLLLDSGSDCLTLVRETARDFEPLMIGLPLDHARMLTHTGFTSRVLTGVVPKLTIAGRMLMEVAVVLVRGETADEHGAGLLPTSVFQSVYFSNQRGMVILNPTR